MKISKLILLFFVGILLVSMVSAIDFSITDVNVNPSGVYQGDSPTLTVKVTADQSNFCKIVCDWSINVGPDFNGVVSGNSNNPKTILATGEDEIFPFRVNANGLSTSYILSVTCDNENPICFANEVTHQYSNTLSFDYAGDGDCTTSKERCENYGDYTGTDDCACTNPPKECRPDSERGADSWGCSTYCGNGIAEEIETCSTCQMDVGKCDGLSCISSSECANNYCVHESCWNNPYKEGDGFCDLENGENNKNSQIDCACADSERWDAIGQKCETYCGNGFCEASEVGICKEDCQFCGDGQCSNNEDCRICETDCGACENEELNQEVTERIKGGVEESIKGANSRQKNITLGAIAAIVLFVIGYFLFKVKKEKKKASTKKGDGEKKQDHKSKVAELEASIKKHKKIIDDHHKAKALKETKKKTKKKTSKKTIKKSTKKAKGKKK